MSTTNKPTQVEPGLFAILQDFKGSALSIVELRNRYEERFGLAGNPNRSTLRDWLYRRLLYLEKKKILVRQDGPGGETRFKTTDLFDRNVAARPVSVTAEDCESQVKHSTGFDVLLLREKLMGYEVDMLAAKGEYAEYIRLAKQYPHLSEVLDPLALKAREASSELLGQTRAITTFLKAAGCDV